MTANELRGEVDLELEGERFVLRPSYTAIIEIEKLTGKSLIELATDAGDGKLSLGDTATIVTCLIKAWGKAEGDPKLQGIKVERIGELVHEFGLMQVQLRLALVLGMAATGGCKADGKPRRDDDSAGEPEATGETETSATSAASSQD